MLVVLYSHSLLRGGLDWFAGSVCSCENCLLLDFSLVWLALWPCWRADLHSISFLMLDAEDVAGVLGGVKWFVLGLMLLLMLIGLMLMGRSIAFGGFMLLSHPMPMSPVPLVISRYTLDAEAVARFGIAFCSDEC
ncbi:hypothetical protein Nepgr_023061 [Nepenthes gracilis]|uniref:Uncharacterized protein n=1 Tax=Nepenthes gracilis TaxID=150966 RepID=A0AAD3T215_NEPGR|nr:hypothetical protein Nepgr_023061 [Nepenthes gracilis]